MVTTLAVRVSFVALLGAAGGQALAAPQAAPNAGPSSAVKADCICRSVGRTFHLGQEACIRGRVARCEMVLNNTSWRMTGVPCPQASLGEGRRRGN